METTQSPPANTEKTEVQKPATSTKPLPATEEDFHTRPSRTQSSGFRIGVVIAVVVLLVAGFFAYRYFTSYDALPATLSNSTSRTINTCRREPCW